MHIYNFLPYVAASVMCYQLSDCNKDRTDCKALKYLLHDPYTKLYMMPTLHH